MRRTISLREDVCRQDAKRTLEVDESAHTIRRVKMLGFESQNGRRYSPEAVRKRLSAYEGIKGNIDHDESPRPGGRRFADRFCRYVNVTMDESGVYGDMNYNPEHPLAPTFVWWAKNDPGAIGLSHDASGRGEEDAEGVFEVDELIEVNSVDVVADPATTSGLFESQNPMKAMLKKLREQVAASKSPHKAALLKLIEDADSGISADAGGDASGAAADPSVGDTPGDSDPVTEDDTGDWKADVLAAIGKLLSSTDPGASDLVSKLMACLKGYKAATEDDGDGGGTSDSFEDDDSSATGDDVTEDNDAANTTTVEDDDPGADTVESLRAKVDAYKLKEDARAVRVKSRKLCEAARLPAEAITPTFLESLCACKSDKQRQRLIDDRRKILSSGARSRKPTSAGRDGADTVTFDAFVDGLKEFHTSQS